MRSSSAAVFFGAVAVLAIPVDVAIAQFLKGIELLQSLYVAVPVSLLCALIALAASRRDRFARSRSIYASDGRWGTRLAWAGLYVAVTGVGALFVYGILRAAQ